MAKAEGFRPDRGIQMGFGGEFVADPDGLASLIELLPIAKSLKKSPPLVVVTSLKNRATGRMDSAPVASFAPEGARVYASMSDLVAANIGNPGTIIIFVDCRFGVPICRQAKDGEPGEEELLREYLASFGRRRDKTMPRVFFIEDRRRSSLDESAVAARRKWLKSMGLADIEFRSPIADTKEGLRLVYTVARPAIKPERHETTIAGRSYVKAIMRELVESLEARGYEPISLDKIKDLLSATRFPPDALSRLKAGFGILVKYHCGICIDFISIQGNRIPVIHCDDEQCAERAKEIESIVHRHNRMILGRDMPYDICPDRSCRQQRYITRSTWDDDGKSKWVKIEECVTCPSHPGTTADHGRRVFSVRRYLPGGRARLVRFKDLEEEEQTLR